MLNGDELHPQRQYLFGARIFPPRLRGQARLHEHGGRARSRSARTGSTTSITCWSKEALRAGGGGGRGPRRSSTRGGEGIIDALNILYAGQKRLQRRSLAAQLLDRSALRRDAHESLPADRPRAQPVRADRSARSATRTATCCAASPTCTTTASATATRWIARVSATICLMGSGNHLDFGRSPAPVCAYLRDLAGWCDTVVDLNVPGTYNAVHGGYGEVMKFHDQQAERILHRREPVAHGARPLRSGQRAGRLPLRHPRLERIAGRTRRPNITNARCCRRTAAAIWKPRRARAIRAMAAICSASSAGTVLSSISLPHTREWDGRESGLVLSDISSPDATITFRVGAATLVAQAASGEQTPNLAIPDNRQRRNLQHHRHLRLGHRAARSKSTSTSRTPTSATCWSNCSPPRDGGPRCTRVTEAPRTTS